MLDFWSNNWGAAHNSSFLNICPLGGRDGRACGFYKFRSICPRQMVSSRVYCQQRNNARSAKQAYRALLLYFLLRGSLHQGFKEPHADFRIAELFLVLLFDQHFRQIIFRMELKSHTEGVGGVLDSFNQGNPVVRSFSSLGQRRFSKERA